MELMGKEFAEQAVEFFSDEECSHMFFYGEITKEILKEILDDGWYFLVEGDYHVTAFNIREDNSVEAHTYTKKIIKRRDAIVLLNSVIQTFEMSGIDSIYTYVPEMFKQTENFLVKRLGFKRTGYVVYNDPFPSNELMRKI